MKTITEYTPLLFTRIAERQTAREARTALSKRWIERAITVAVILIYGLIIYLCCVAAYHAIRHILPASSGAASTGMQRLPRHHQRIVQRPPFPRQEEQMTDIDIPVRQIPLLTRVQEANAHMLFVGARPHHLDLRRLSLPVVIRPMQRPNATTHPFLRRDLQQLPVMTWSEFVERHA